MMWNVMIADDEPYIRQGLEKLVDWQALDCRLVYSASNGAELLEQIKKDPPEIAVIDIKMPVMDGLQVAEYIFANDLPTTVIFLTAYADFQYAQKAIQCGVSDYIIKTSALEDVPAAIKKIKTKRELERGAAYRAVLIKPAACAQQLHCVYKHSLQNLEYQVLQLGDEVEALVFREKDEGQMENILKGCGEIKLFGKTFLGIQIGMVCSWSYTDKRENEAVCQQLLRHSEEAAGMEDVLVVSDRGEVMEEADGESLLLRIQTYIGDHYAERLALGDIAQAVHVSAGYLSRFYKNKTGENLFDAINRLRIHKAKELLRQGNKKIYEIAELTGFDDTAYFSKVFKKYAGCPPREYEQECVK